MIHQKSKSLVSTLRFLPEVVQNHRFPFKSMKTKHKTRPWGGCPPSLPPRSHPGVGIRIELLLVIKNWQGICQEFKNWRDLLMVSVLSGCQGLQNSTTMERVSAESRSMACRNYRNIFVCGQVVDVTPRGENLLSNLFQRFHYFDWQCTRIAF